MTDATGTPQTELTFRGSSWAAWETAITVWVFENDWPLSASCISSAGSTPSWPR